MKATFDYYWTHALISDEAYRAIQSMCTFANQNYSIACQAALRSASAEIGHIDHYNIYAPLCRGPSGSTSASVRFIETNVVYGNISSEISQCLRYNMTVIGESI